MTGLEALAYEIHRAGGPTDEERAMARDLLERRGQLARVKEINERLSRACDGISKKDVAA